MRETDSCSPILRPASMVIYPIRTFPDPVLSIVAAEVTRFDADLVRLVDGMFATMYDAPGVGLAAPQVGISKRVFVADVGEGPIVMVNPAIVETAGIFKYEEGCLSVPDLFWQIKRPDYARAVGVSLTGEPVMHEGEGLMGRVLQHEIDHLNGTLLLSHLGKRIRRQVLQELRREALGFKGAL